MYPPANTPDNQQYMNGGSHGSQNGPDRRLPHRQRFPDVDQALRFSPFASIVPFSADVVPMPNARLPGFPTAFSNTAERQRANQELDRLSQELLRDPNRSSAASRTANELKKLLHPEEITDFKFKIPPQVHHGESRRQSSSNGRCSTPTPHKLGPFASSLLKDIHLDHQLPTPVSPGGPRPSVNGSKVSKTMKSTNPQATACERVPQVTISPEQLMKYPQSDPRKNSQSQQTSATKQETAPRTSYSTPTAESLHGRHRASAHNQSAPPKISSQRFQGQTMVATAVQVPQPSPRPYVNGSHLPSPVTPTTQALAGAQNLPSTPKPTPQPMVVILPTSATAMQSVFVTNDIPSSEKVTRKRKRGFGDDSQVYAQETRDQRATTDSVLRQFHETVEEIFEADNQSQPDAQYFITVRHDDQGISTLTQATHVKLDLLLQKINAFGRLAEIPLEDLQRLQSLSAGALSSVENQDFDLDSSGSAEAFEAWAQRLEIVDLGLRAARTILRTMSGGREEKSLYPEDLLVSIINTIQKVADKCIIPTVETRSSSSAFEHLQTHRKVSSELVHHANKVLGLLAKLLANEEMADIVTPIEFFAIRLLFVENASNEKDSVLGIQKYEMLRRTAMDIIAIVFSRYPGQRAFLFDEILMSLQRLPTTRQAARQYRLRDGRAIRLVTALIIQLVQATTTVASPARKRKAAKPIPNDRDESNGANMAPKEEAEEDNTSESDDSGDSSQSESRSSAPIRKLEGQAIHLCEDAAESAKRAVGYLMHRAQSSTKSGDEPHRQLLDIFLEDLLSVLTLPEWPGAELLVRAVCARAITIFENPKSSAPAKNMALELLGTMGSAISDLVARTKTAVTSQEQQTSRLSSDLARMFDEYVDGSLDVSELLLWGGPYHAVAVHLERAGTGDLQIISAQAYYLAQWAKAVCSANQKASPDGEKVAGRLSTMLAGAEWISCESFDDLSPVHCNIAYALTLLNMDFCRRFDYILRILIDSVTSEQTTVRSRGLKSVTQMFEKDPSILDRAGNVKNVILRCASDTSPMVRDAALSLIGKCITIKPAWEAELLPNILHFSNDAAVGVRKRSLKLLRDIYLRNTSQDTRAAISDSLIHRVKDHDTGVADLARQTFEEMWITPLFLITETSNIDARAEIILRNHLLLTIKTSGRRPSTPSILVSLFSQLLSKESKNATHNFNVCKALVKTAFEIMIDSAQAADAPEQSQILETLTTLARADPRLFDSGQLQILQPYIGNLTSLNDLNVFRPVVVIFRCVLPVLSTVEQSLLEDVHAALLKSVSRLFKTELNEVAQCVWALNQSLKRPDSLVRLIASVIKNLRNLKDKNFSDVAQKENMGKVRKYMHIAGLFGKHCDFEASLSTFQNILPDFKGNSVARLIIESLEPYSLEHQPLALRAVAFDCIGLICQSKPSQFQVPSVEKAFTSILRSGESELQEIILSTFRDFFTIVEHQTAPKSEESMSENGPATTKLESSMKADKRDEASSLISQYFLKHIIPIALASQELSALTATEVVASINRQGAAFPKESIPALVALGTSTNASISHVALEEHRRQHQLHETMFEGEYVKGICEAFRYQQRVVGDPLGFTASPITAKLGGLWDVVKTSKAKFQKKFLSNFCSKIDFEPDKLDMSTSPSVTLQFSRFLTENVAFFDYNRLEELLHVLACMEKVVADTGSGVAHRISTEIFHVVVKEEATEVAVPPSQPAVLSQSATKGPRSGEHPAAQSQKSASSPPPVVDSARLEQLTNAAIILSILWDARIYLRRLYGQTTSAQRRESRGRPSKDLSKAPTRAQGVSGEKLVATIAEKVASLNNKEAMMKQCRDFVELMSVDSEVKVNAEVDESLGDRADTPTLEDEEERDTPMCGASRGTKRKGSLSAAGTPTKKRGRPPLGRKKSSRQSVDRGGSDGDWM